MYLRLHKNCFYGGLSFTQVCCSCQIRTTIVMPYKSRRKNFFRRMTSTWASSSSLRGLRPPMPTHTWASGAEILYMARKYLTILHRLEQQHSQWFIILWYQQGVLYWGIGSAKSHPSPHVIVWAPRFSIWQNGTTY